MSSFNIAGRLYEALEKAQYITDDLKLSELKTFAVVMAILMDEECPIVIQLLESGCELDTSSMIYAISGNPELYEKITGMKYSMPESIVDTEEKEQVEQEETKPSSAGDIAQINNYYYILGSFPQEELLYENIPFSENLTKAFEDAFTRCKSSGKEYIDAENLLYSILSNQENSACSMLNEFKFDVVEWKEILLYNSEIFEKKEAKDINIPKPLQNSCTILNNHYKKGDENIILKREKEIFNVWNVFSKKTKRNCILVGDAGVGKTAIVEAITLQIVNEKCPKEFRGFKVISLDLTSMVAGTKYRGEFEIKVQSLIKFIEKTPNLIVFVDEIHQIMGTGAAEGSGPDLSGALKPILARDDVIFIGATTTMEYEKFFSRDPALKRRFEKVEVKEPKLDEVKAMISAKISNISTHHGVQIDEEVLDYIIITAKAMNYHGNNPDLTVDLVDRSMAVAKMKGHRRLKKSHVDKVYASNYERYKKISHKDKLSTAYHEAGHALMRMLAKADVRENVKIVSIVPSDDYLGVTISEENNSCRPITRQAVLESAGISLAGRVAQEFVTKDWDFGASSDLVSATEIIRRMIIEMGMDESIYTNISLYSYNSGHTMSDEALDKVNERIKETMDRVYTNTKNTLIANKQALSCLADMLMKKGIISIKEIELCFKENGIKLVK